MVGVKSTTTLPLSTVFLDEVKSRPGSRQSPSAAESATVSLGFWRAAPSTAAVHTKLTVQQDAVATAMAWARYASLDVNDKMCRFKNAHDALVILKNKATLSNDDLNKLNIIMDETEQAAEAYLGAVNKSIELSDKALQLAHEFAGKAKEIGSEGTAKYFLDKCQVYYENALKDYNKAQAKIRAWKQEDPWV
jgi:hypothetical protein